MATLSQLIARHAGVKQRAVVPAYRAMARANVFLPGPRVFANSFPKGGTHLLSALLGELPRMMFSGVHCAAGDFTAGAQRPEPENLDWERLRRTLGRVNRGQFMTAHFPYVDGLDRDARQARVPVASHPARPARRGRLGPALRRQDGVARPAPAVHRAVPDGRRADPGDDRGLPGRRVRPRPGLDRRAACPLPAMARDARGAGRPLRGSDRPGGRREPRAPGRARRGASPATLGDRSLRSASAPWPAGCGRTRAPPSGRVGRAAGETS